MDWPDVGIVLVNWNNYADTAECLKSLEQLDYPDYRVIVVDNGSPDGSGERLAEEFTWCDFVLNDENLGFGGGCNTGINHALSLGLSHVLLLNNDAVIDRRFLKEIISVARESEADIVGALVRTMSGDYVNPTPSKHPDMFFYSGYRSNLPFTSGLDGMRPERWWPSDRVEGAGLLLPRYLLQEREASVGYYLDDSLFMYGEEIELATWCREWDRTCVIARDAVVHHSGGGSSDRPFQLYYLTRNRALIAHRYFAGVERVGFDLLFLLTRFLIAARFLRRKDFAATRAIVVGLVDGYRGIEGETWTSR